MQRSSKKSISSLAYQSLEPRKLLVADFISGNLFIEGTDGNDAISIIQSTDAATIEILSNNVSVNQFTANQIEQVTFLGGDGDDSLQLVGFTSTLLQELTFDGGAGNDRLEFTDGTDIELSVFQFTGGEGNDVLNGTDSSLDLMRNFFNPEVFSGGAGDDFLDISFLSPTSTAEVTLEGGAGNDVLIGSNNEDEIIGGDGDDLIFARGGEDLSLIHI